MTFNTMQQYIILIYLQIQEFMNNYYTDNSLIINSNKAQPSNHPIGYINIHPKYIQMYISNCYISWIMFANLSMIALLLTLLYYFSKIAMEHRKLSQEQANKLLEATFLLISQQNIAQKQRILKNPHSPTPTPAYFYPPSPQKTRPTPKDTLTPEPHHPPRITNPQNSPPLTIAAISKKWSIEKSSSYSEIADPEVVSASKLEWKESDSDQGSPLPAPRLNSHPISEEIGPGTLEKHQQMQEEDDQNLLVESMIKEVKRDLEIRSRGKICKSQQVNSKTGQVMGYNFYCKIDPDCPFSCALVYTGNRNAKNEKLYKLIYQCETHSKGCIESEEQVAFMRLTKTIDQLQPDIVMLLTQNPDMKPKDMLAAISAQQGQEGHRFIYRGLISKSYHKAAKKYFDNMIYKIKSQMGML